MAVVMPPHSHQSPSREAKKKEIYKYAAPWTVYGMNWSVRQDRRFQLALGSFIEDYTNKIQIIDLDEERGEFALKATFDHPYPATKIMWIPDQVRRGRGEGSAEAGRVRKGRGDPLLSISQTVHFLNPLLSSLSGCTVS